MAFVKLCKNNGPINEILECDKEIGRFPRARGLYDYQNVKTPSCLTLG